jgi:transcriptional regulator with XRE-family HTH domain
MWMRHVGVGVAALRKRRGWSQRELAAVVGVSQQLISRLEHGLLEGISAGALDRVVVALGGRLRFEILAAGPVQVDRRHAALQEWLAAALASLGWLVAAEHSFNHYGDRGRVDLLAFHTASEVLLVFEVKTRIDDVQDLLGRLDVKCRLGRTMAEQLGWMGVEAVVPALLLADARTNRRRVGDHRVLFSRFALRGQSARAWLRRPASARPIGVLIYHDPGQIRPR